MKAANVLILCVGIMFAAPTRAQQTQDVAPAKGQVAAVGEAKHEFRIVSTTDVIVDAYPTLWWIVDDPMFGEMHAIETWFSFRYAGHSGRMVVALTEVPLASVPNRRASHSPTAWRRHRSVTSCPRFPPRSSNGPATRSPSVR